MTDITESKYNMYKALIALVWADGHVTESESKYMRSYITNLDELNFDQREELLTALVEKPDIDAIWNDITDKRDRAFVLDMATSIFYADGEYSIAEKQLYADLLQKHLATLDEKTHALEIKRLQEQARISSLQDEEAYQQEIEKENDPGVSRVERFLYKVNKKLGKI